MKISVIIPTYAPGPYLIECLNSLDNQTLPKDMFEVVIVLNGTLQPYYKLISEYISKSELSANLIYTTVIGVSNARNIALDKAKSDFVAFVDDDDIVSPSYLEGLLSATDNKSIVVSNSKTFEDDISRTGKNYITSTYEGLKNKKAISVISGRRFFSNGCGKLIPVSVIGKSRFDDKLKKGEDSVFMVEISRNISRVLIAPDDVIYYVRIRNGSASRIRRAFVEILESKYYEFKKYLSFYFKFPPSYNLFFVTIIMAAGLKSFFEDVYKSIRYGQKIIKTLF